MLEKRSTLVRDLLNNNSLFVSQLYADKSLALLYCMLCWSKKGFQMAPQSRIAVETLSNLATTATVTVDWNVKARTNNDIIHAPYVNRILLHMVIWNAIPEIH